MNHQNLFFNDTKLRTLWRILIFVCLVALAISPLILLKNSFIQFFGALLILILGLYLSSKYLDKRDFSAYGLVFRKETFVHLLVGIIIGSFSVVFLLFIGKVTGILSVAVAAKIPSLSSLLLFAFKMFLVAVLEETFFRGYLFTNIYDGFKSETVTKKQAILIAVMLSSVLFGLAHIGTNNASLLSIIFLSINGMVWCIPFIITKNLGLSIGLHLSWNFAQTQIGFTMSGNKAVNSFYSIQNNGSDILTGGDYGPEAGIIGLVGFMMMLVLSITYLKLKQV